MPPDHPNSLICYVFLALAAAGPLQCEHLEPPVVVWARDRGQGLAWCVARPEGIGQVAIAACVSLFIGVGGGGAWALGYLWLRIGRPLNFFWLRPSSNQFFMKFCGYDLVPLN